MQSRSDFPFPLFHIPLRASLRLSQYKAAGWCLSNQIVREPQVASSIFLSIHMPPQNHLAAAFFAQITPGSLPVSSLPLAHLTHLIRHFGFPGAGLWIFSKWP